MMKQISFIRSRRYTRERKKSQAEQLLLAVIFVALIAVLLVVILSRKTTMSMLKQSEETLISSVYANVTSLERSYQKMSLPGADVENDILPQMRIDLNAAMTVHQILVDVYGDDRAVLSDDMFSLIGDSISHLEGVIEMGKSQDEARERMGQCMEKVQSAMMQRFPNDTSMMPITT